MQASVREVYKLRHQALLWFDSARILPSGDSLLAFITKADHYGLIPQDYHIQLISELLNDSTSNQNFIRADLLLTDSFFALRAHLQFGRVNLTTYERIDRSKLIDNSGVLYLNKKDENILIRNQLESQEPKHLQYHWLKKSLHQLLVAGRTDTTSLKEIVQLKMTIERWRFINKFPSRYIHVNIPSATMQVIERDSIMLESNVIVGKPETPTPLLESTITSFIIYPYWHVPKSIATRELLPTIQNDPTYLVKHNYDVLDRNGDVVDMASINWAGLNENNFPYVLRQREGFENTMGIIKFLFNNHYGVYLHDTNGRKLFSRKMRALSHGCVRVHRATELARYLVKEDSVYITPDDLDQYLSFQQRYKIDIRHPIPLTIQYFTCEWKGGRLFVYEDIYGKDKILEQSLYNKSEIKDLNLAEAGL